MRKLRTYLAIAGVVLSSLLLSLMLVLDYNSYRYKHGKSYEYAICKVISGSMEPEIMTGDYCLIKQVNLEAVGIGDNICFTVDWVADTVFMHKIVKLETDQEGLAITTRGINNKEQDEGVRRVKDLRGVVIYHVPCYALWIMRILICATWCGLFFYLIVTYDKES